MKKSKLPAADCAEDDDDEPAQQAKPEPNPRAFENIAYSTKLAEIIRSNLNPKWRGLEVRIDLPAGPIGSEALRLLFPRMAQAEREIGKLFLDALTTGDKNFPEQVKKAMREIDRMFNRTDLVVLVRQVMPFFDKVEAVEAKGKKRALVEKKLGRKLYDQEWNRLQKYFGWDKGIQRPRPRKSESLQTIIE